MIPIKIFISSVQQEFASERKRLAEYIRTDALLGRFFKVFIFEELPAMSQTAAQVYLEEVEHTDIYLALLGFNYGYEDCEGISPTEREFDVAQKHHKNSFIFIKRTESEKRDQKESDFIKKVEQCVVRKSFREYEELQSQIYTSLVRYLEDNEYLRLLPFDATLHPSATLADIDVEKVDLFVEKARKKRAFPLLKDAGIERILQSLNLLDKGKISNAALLLFGKEPQKFFPTSEVKCVQFYGNTISKPLASYQVFYGTLFEMVDNAVSFVMSHIDAHVGVRDKKAEINVEFELPINAVTECIVNAVCHRDYTSNGSVQVMLFPNRLEVWSPGRLPYGITTAQLLIPHSSIPTNPILANPLYLAGYIERLGTGTSDMVDDCVTMGLKIPEFTQDSNFRVIIWRKNGLTSGKNDLSSEQNGLTSVKNDPSSEQGGLTSVKNNPNIKANLSKKQMMVLDFCKDYSRSSSEIFEYIGIFNNSRSREKYITQLIMKGLLLPTKTKLNDPNQKYISAADPL